MRKRVSAIIVALWFGLLVSIISGCAANRVDLVDSGPHDDATLHLLH